MIPRDYITEWRLDSRSTRTLGGTVFSIGYKLKSNQRKSKYNKTYRNPLIYAMELKAEMDRERLSQADLARKYGISRARVNQWLSLLKLPKRETERILAMGDNWKRRLMTERMLRDWHT